MRRVAARIRELRTINRRTAEVASASMDVLVRSGLTPGYLRGAQNGLRRDLVGTERQRLLRRLPLVGSAGVEHDGEGRQD